MYPFLFASYLLPWSSLVSRTVPTLVVVVHWDQEMSKRKTSKNVFWLLAVSSCHQPLASGAMMYME